MGVFSDQVEHRLVYRPARSRSVGSGFWRIQTIEPNLETQETPVSAAAPQTAKGKKPAGAKLLARILEVLDDNKAEDVVTIDLAEKSPLADYMVVESGRSQRQVQALADYVGRAVKETAARVKVEGQAQGDWVLIDAGDVVVHLFRPEVRAFYKVEAMWGLPTPEKAHSNLATQ